MTDDPRAAPGLDDAAPGELPLVALDWRRAVLVCGECEQRKDGPRHLGAKQARRLLKHSLRGGAVGGGVRVLVTGCLGPCPRKALTVVTVGAGTGAVAAGAAPRAFALQRVEDLDAAVAGLRGADPR